MERREYYDPEDIESLLHERGFDELLEEERAYVLRHLSGREEYESMRSLLHHVRDDERTHGPIVADADVKANVMAAFRSQQAPQWRVWLNSLGTLFWPKDALAAPFGQRGLWRPALAYASLALLIVAGVQVVRFSADGTAKSQVAQVKELKPAPPPSTTVTQQEHEQKAAESTDSTPMPAPVLEQQQFTTVVATDASVASEVAEGSAVQEPVLAAAEQQLDMEGEAPLQEVAVATEEKREEDIGTFAAPAAPVTISGASTSHVVTRNELEMNMRVANAGVPAKEFALAKRKAEYTGATAGSVAQDPALLGLLSAGW